MPHQITDTDIAFKDEVEHLSFPIPEFGHRAHLRLAYVYLVETGSTEMSVDIMRSTLTKLLEHAGIDPSEKFHETLTEAWILAVNYFMGQTKASSSADDFIDQHPEMLDSRIMLTHYSAEVLFSDEARQAFVEPNLDPIPNWR